MRSDEKVWGKQEDGKINPDARGRVMACRSWVVRSLETVGKLAVYTGHRATTALPRPYVGGKELAVHPAATVR